MPDNNVNVMLPYNREAEQSVLGSILVDSSCMSIATKYLTAENFFLPEHREIFAAMMSMSSGKDSHIDTITVADALAKSGYRDAAGARNYIFQLAQSVPSVSNIENYAQIVREQYYLRSLIQISHDIIDSASATDADAKVIMESAEQKLYDMRKGKESNGPKKLKEVIVNGVYDRLRNLNGENKDDYKGMPTGFGMLDKYITGLNKSDLVLIGARPAMGKTSFALNLAHNLAVCAKKKVVFFSLEMTNEQLAERLLASQCAIDAKKFRTGEFSDDEWVRLGNAASALYDTELYLSDATAITVPEMKSIVRRMRDVDCVIIDYLGLVNSSERAENRVQEVTKITKNLKMMAKDLNIPVVCCAQLSRGTEGRGKSHRPQLSDLRESGSIEQDADIVMFLYREVYYAGEKLDDEQIEDIDKNKTELIVAKNRHGETGTIDLIFDSEYTRFRPLENNERYS